MLLHHISYIFKDNSDHRHLYYDRSVHEVVVLFDCWSKTLVLLWTFFLFLVFTHYLETPKTTDEAAMFVCKNKRNYQIFFCSCTQTWPQWRHVKTGNTMFKIDHTKHKKIPNRFNTFQGPKNTNSKIMPQSHIIKHI